MWAAEVLRVGKHSMFFIRASRSWNWARSAARSEESGSFPTKATINFSAIWKHISLECPLQNTAKVNTSEKPGAYISIKKNAEWLAWIWCCAKLWPAILLLLTELSNTPRWVNWGSRKYLYLFIPTRSYNKRDRQQQVLARMWRNWNPHTLLVRL